MKRPRANRLGMYADVRAILDAAMSSGGGLYECETHGQAVHWRQRAYQFRKLFAETLGLANESPYDSLTLPRIAPDSSVVHIKVRQHVGVFVPSSAPVDVFVEDELFEEAAALAARLEGESK